MINSLFKTEPYGCQETIVEFGKKFLIGPRLHLLLECAFPTVSLGTRAAMSALLGLFGNPSKNKWLFGFDFELPSLSLDRCYDLKSFNRFHR